MLKQIEYKCLRTKLYSKCKNSKLANFNNTCIIRLECRRFYITDSNVYLLSGKLPHFFLEDT